MKPLRKNYNIVFLDIDGTIVDSNHRQNAFGKPNALSLDYWLKNTTRENIFKDKILDNLALHIKKRYLEGDYIVITTARTLSQDDLEYRISKFNFSGKLKGKEKDISIDYRHFRFNADSLEKLLHLVLKIKGVEKVNDKNLGSGYTEWYFCSPKQMNAHVLTTIRAYRKILKEKKAKQKRV